MRYLVPVLLVGLIACSAYAAVYEWIDDAGVINFTDNRDNIPEKYRAKARVKDLSQEKNISVLKETSPPPAASGSSAGGTSYGGHDVEWWSSRLAVVRQEIKGIEDSLPDKREQLLRLQHRRRVFQKSSDRVAYNEMKKEIEADEAKIRELQEKLVRLQNEASAAGVPK